MSIQVVGFQKEHTSFTTWKWKSCHYILAITEVDPHNKNSSASETLALDDGADASYLIGSLIKEIFLLPNINCMIDSKSLFDALTTTNVTKDKVDIAGYNK